MKTASAPLSSASFTMRTLSTNPRQAIPSIMAKSQTSTSQWATGSIKRPSGFASTTMGPSQATTCLRGPTNSPTSLTCMRCPTTVSTPLSRHSCLGSGTCSLVPVGTSSSCSKLWLTWMTRVWPTRSCATVNLTTMSQPSPSRSSNINTTLTLSEHGLHHVSPTLCSPMPPNGSPRYKTCLGRLGQYVRDERGVVICHAASMFAPHHWRMSRDVHGCPS
jgi:hypothetical protein